MDASLHPRFHSSRITSAFVIDLYVGLPPLVGGGRVGISPVKLTNHFLEANPPHTLTLGRRLTVHAADRRSPRGRSPCFTISRKLALRLGRIVNPPQVLFLGSFVATCYRDTSCLPPREFGKQVLNRHGPAQVGFDRHASDLNVYAECLSSLHD